ncbi:MAG: hypothetical protein HRU19_22510 [Pseudobacteriovorax sp.]|nr:hypothetical protein [Pseudobacteriovorax sp.]
MSSTLSKLQQVVAENTGQPVATVNTATLDSEDSGALVASLEEQLHAFYSDQDYASEHFPNQSLRSVLEWAVHTKQKLAESKAGGAAEPFTFVPGEVMAVLGNIDQATSDSLDFGVVEVDDTGAIKIYNQYEGNLAGIQPASALGKNFFTPYGLLPPASSAMTTA